MNWLEWIEDFLSGPFFAAGNAIWEYFIGLVQDILIKSPMAYAPEAWNFVEGVLYPWSLSIGMLMLNLFFFIGMFKQASNLRQNFTLEVMVETGIRWAVVNMLMLFGMSLIKHVLDIAAAMMSDLFNAGSIAFRITAQELDIGMTLFMWLFGLIYLIVCIVCGIMIFLAVYGRFLQLYMLVIVGPMALSTAVGGNGIANTAYAWTKTFVAKVFEVVLICIALILASKISMGIGFMDSPDGIGDWFDGFALALQSVIVMIMATASVKGVDAFMRRSFGL